MPLLSDIRLDGSLLDGTSVNVTLSENASSGQVIGFLTTGFTYRLVQDAGRMVFLDGNQLRLTESALLDDETQPELHVTLEATDAEGNSVFVTAVIGIDPGHEVLRGTEGSDTLAGENFRQEFFVGDKGDDRIELDAGDLAFFSGQRSDYDVQIVDYLDDGYGGVSGAEFQITDLRLEGDGSDLVIASTYSNFRFADGDYNFFELESATSTKLMLDGRALEIDKIILENQGPAVLGQLSMRGQPGESLSVLSIFVMASGPDVWGPVMLSGADNPFAIDAAGVLSVTAPLDFETYDNFEIVVTFQDATGNLVFDTLNIQTANVDEAPELIYGPGQFFPMEIESFTDTSLDLNLGDFYIVDRDGTTGTVSYVLGGADADKFFVQNGYLFLRAGTEIDTGSAFDFDLNVTLQDSALPQGGGEVYDLDIKVTRPSPLDSLDWDYVAPPVIRVFVLPGGLTVTEDYLDFTDPDTSFTSTGFSSAQIAAISAAFGVFANVANLSFSFVTDLSQADFAMIAMPDMEGNTLADWAIAGGTLTAGGTSAVLDGWGRFNMAELGSSSFLPGSEAFFTLIHEIGHGLGLAHPHDDGGGSTVMEGVTDDFGSYGLYDLNQAIYTIMSYNRGWAIGPDGSPNETEPGHAAGPAALDIGLLQQKYGANATTGAGDNGYDMTELLHTTIWDTGGLDRIYHNGTEAVEIHLQAATLDYSATGGGLVSHVNGQRGGLTIAAGVVIEEAAGGSGNDLLTGNAADNRLIGQGGDDTLLGGDGNDTLLGGGGTDRLEGGAGYDIVSYGPQNWRVWVDLAKGTASRGDVLTGIEGVTGSRGSDRLAGDAGGNILRGGLGADALFGRGGDDTLVGGAGADKLNGGAGRDRASYDTAASGVQVDLGMGLGLSGDALDDVFVSIEDLRGSAHGDILTGNDTANLLNGAEGDDTLSGMGGNDTLVGGDGADVFVFGIGMGEDRITDFGIGDLIRLSEDLWTSLGVTSAADLLTSHATQMADHVLFSLGASASLRLNGALLAGLEASQISLDLPQP